MYPHGGFVDETGLGGQLFDPSKGAARSTSIDAMVPAFLAAYSNRSLSDRNNLIPALWDLLPNWTISYDGLTQIPFMC